MDAEARDEEKAQGGQEGPRTGNTDDRRVPGERRKPAKRQNSSSEGILPKVATEDEPRSWGDEGGYDHDAWLKEQRPPHWG
jgi:hypothetical protein